jgi:hypothetical protein
MVVVIAPVHWSERATGGRIPRHGVERAVARSFRPLIDLARSCR